jgi:hypothetical protein
MPHRLLAVVAVAFAALLDLSAAESSFVVTTIPNARQPQVAVSTSGKVFLTFGAKNAIYCCVSVDGGDSFGSPVKVSEEGHLALGMRRGPRIAATKDSIVITAICGQQGGGKDGDVLAWRSRDEGRTWQGPVRINSVAGAAREGLHHLTASADGLLYCVWNDLRTPRQMPIYGALSKDGGATWTDEKVVYACPEGSICPCCQPVAAFDPQGKLHVMWRNQLAGSRDMYLTTSADGGRSFAAAQKLGQGTWQLDT